MRRLCFLALLAGCITARAQVLGPPPAPDSAPAQPMSAEDERTVYGELRQTHDGFIYTLYLLRYTSEEAAQKVWGQLQEPRYRSLGFDRIFKNLTQRPFYLFALEPEMRARVVSLFNGQRTGVVKGRNGWYIGQLISTRAVAPPSFEAARPHLADLVARGELPDAERLRTDPALRARSAANAVFSVDALSAAPADLDVNMKLSSQYTLLIRALSIDKADLVEALLKRGADPNLCGRKFCPLQLAIYRGSRNAVDLLLKAGADVNQSDPAIGVLEGPLAAAAYRGDIELAERLISSGAKVNGLGRGEPPLIAAAGAAQREMIERLIAKGADIFETSNGPGLARTALDYAERGKNAEFAAWLRNEMESRAKASGQYAWDGWIEQDGKRYAMDKPVTLRRAPFRIGVHMQSGRVLYASAATEPALFDELRSQARDGSLHFNGSITFESKQANHLVVYVPGKAGERWGGSQAWSKNDRFSSFASIKETPQGVEHVRQIDEILVLSGDDKRSETPVASFSGSSIFLVLGTRIHMTSMNDEVFAPRNVEIRFAP